MELSIEVKDILSNKDKFYSLNRDQISIGRNPGQNIVINNKYISDTHVSIFFKDDKLFVRDENSSNGTKLYSHYKWISLEKKQIEAVLPVQIKLAEAVIVTIQSGESKIISLSEIENDMAIMVLDICGSTNQARNSEQIAYHLKQRLNNIAKPLLYSAPITFYKNTGDGFLATFPQTTQAVNIAMNILKILEKRNKQSKNPPIDVRIGLHKGRTYIIDPATEDIHGIDINLTFRIEGLQKRAFTHLKNQIGEKNRILASEHFYLDYKKRTRRKKEIFEACGSAKLKGIKERVEIYRINWK